MEQPEVVPAAAAAAAASVTASTVNEASQQQGLALKILMQGKEVGSIIGKKGDNVKRYREESGARINISDGSCPERVVTVSGSASQVRHAFGMICRKLEEDLLLAGPANPAPSLAPLSQSVPITLKLLVPGSQCGCLIGKGGAKIKEIREVTGASVQVASDMLPSSTERMVTLSGSAETVISCISFICQVLTESPAKGSTVPYRPRPLPTQPQILYSTTASAGSPTYAMPITALSTSTGHILSDMPVTGVSLPQVSSPTPFILPHAFLPGMGMMSIGTLSRSNITRGRRDGGYLARQMSSPGGSSITCSSSSAAMQLAATVQQLTIPNELIGCIIGRGGSKINEIRQLSGAQIKISNSEEGSSDRKITITGLPETISMATYMIKSSLDCHRSQLQRSATAGTVAAASATVIAKTAVPAATAARAAAAATITSTGDAATTPPVCIQPIAAGSSSPVGTAVTVAMPPQAPIPASHSTGNSGGGRRGCGSCQLVACFGCRSVEAHAAAPLAAFVSAAVQLRPDYRFFPY